MECVASGSARGGTRIRMRHRERLPLVAAGHSSMDTDPVSGRLRITQPSPADIASVRELAPLAADLFIRCGPFDVPAAVVADFC